MESALTKSNAPKRIATTLPFSLMKELLGLKTVSSGPLRIALKSVAHANAAPIQVEDQSYGWSALEVEVLHHSSTDDEALVSDSLDVPLVGVAGEESGFRRHDVFLVLHAICVAFDPYLDAV